MTVKKTNIYDQLHEQSKNIASYSSIQALLEWDQETYMPQGAIDFRSSQLSLLAGLIHKLKTGTKFTHTLNQLIDLESGEVFDASLSHAQNAAMREWRRDHLKAIKLPAAFVRTFTNTCSSAIHIWAEARRESNFSLFAPHLEKIVKLNRKKADLLGFHEHPYDALFDLYEPDMKVSLITPIFGRLKAGLASLVKTIASCPPPKTDFLYTFFPPEKQMEFGHLLLKAMGFDKETSRLDLSTHPFCTGLYPRDTRMTSRLHPEDPMSHIFSVMHEGGHGLYNAGLPLNEYGSPLCEPVSVAVDESQSRWWETLIGRSSPFWEHFFPQLQITFPQQLKHVSFKEFYAAINKIKPSFIRVEADEVTYCLHVILRFEIEKELMEGSLKVKQIPEAWNEKMRTYLGISPEHDDLGCLQDIHWSMGAFGYFPTYALGNLYAAQFFKTFEKAHPDWKEHVSQGNLAFIREWLRENIHQWGRQFTPSELVQRITGGPLSEASYLSYLEHKYKSLYKF